MMSNVLVSLVSDQTIPNVLFIREMENEPGKDIRKYLFISTKKMEEKKKTNCIIQGSHIDNSQTEIIEVVEDSIEDVESKLGKWFEKDISNEDNIIVNLTGGTKIMSIGVYDFFKERKSTIYYLPIGKNIYEQIFPSVKHREHELNFRISLKDYLISYGIDIKSKDIHGTLKDKEYTEHFCRKFLNNEIDMKVIAQLRKERNKKKILLDEKAKTFLDKIKFDTKKEGILSKKEINYLTGGWFEEYAYNLVRKHLPLNDDKIGLSVQISNANTQNEFDIMFVYENVLYVIECKTELRDNGRNLLNDTLYKLSALKKSFGLSVKSYLFTLDKNLRDKNGNIKSDYQKRADLLDIELLVDRVVLSDNNKLKKVFDDIKGK